MIVHVGKHRVDVPEPLKLWGFTSYRMVLLCGILPDDRNTWKPDWEPKTEYTLIVEHTDTKDALGNEIWHRHEASNNTHFLWSIVHSLVKPEHIPVCLIVK